ncbi:MAG TPA: hypothetical protein VI299_04130, partial [Polyangiales bacterium]
KREHDVDLAPPREDGGKNRLTRKAREKSSWGKHTSRDQRERKQERRRDRRSKDEHKQHKRRR